MKQNEINGIQKGSGSLKHYKYFSNGIKLRTKESIVEAINLNLNVNRQDKITKEYQIYDKKNNEWKHIKLGTPLIKVF